MSGLPREVIKWLQSLDLGQPMKNIRRDFSNGFLIAKVYSWYYPHVLEMHTFSNGTSIQAKQANWQQLEKFFVKEKLDVPKELIESTIHSKPGGAKALLEKTYTLLTLKELRFLPSKKQPEDFNDLSYQAQLPPFARSTATQAIKTNLADSELEIEPDRNTCRMKAQTIAEAHHFQKKQEKVDFPDRFSNVKKQILQTKSYGKTQEQPVEITVTQKPLPQM